MTSAEELQRQLWSVAAQLEGLGDAPSTGHRLVELERLFRMLREPSGDDPRDAETQIWAIWCDHPIPDCAAEMARGIRLLSEGDLGGAEAVFDALVVRESGWAEAWNKRATLYFLQGRDSASVDDVAQTLALEPRHFGALGGFAQICVRNRAPDAARAALERIYAVNPSAPGVKETLAALAKRPRTVH